MKDDYIDFIRGCNQPKLDWVINQLELIGVEYFISGVGINGSILQVRKGQLETAATILNTTVGIMNIGGTLTDDAIKVADLRDDHPFFNSQIDIEDLPGPEEGPFDNIDKPEPVRPVVLPKPEATPAEIAENSPDDGPTPSEEFETPATGPIETPAESEDNPFEDDDDDDLWDISEDEDAPDPALDYLKADKILTHAPVEFNNVPVEMYEVDSENLASFGYRVNQKDQDIVTLYVTFKGGTQPYRYGPVSIAEARELQGEAVRKLEGQPASVGSMYHHLIKVKAENGDIRCQRLVDKNWVDVPAKKDRLKAAKERVKE